MKPKEKVSENNFARMFQKKSGLQNTLEDFDLSRPEADDQINVRFGQLIKLDIIHPDPKQPRKTFNEESIQSLAESIKTNGLITPILVRPNGEGYMIVAGERRHRACVIAGLDAVPCIIKDVTGFEAFKLSLIENLQKEDLDPFEEAAAYQSLIDDYGMTQEEIGKIVGKKQSTISHIMSVNKLPESVCKKYATSHIPKSQLVEIAKAPTEEVMENLAEKTVQESLTVKDIREATKAAKTKEAIPSRAKNSDVFKTLMNMAISYTKVLNKLAENDISTLSENERNALRDKIIENRKIEDAWLDRLPI
ncbi:MAG: ParB/RepB/Spo0J family partition protein [Desulfomonilia bacterium]|jgi:ParB family chromosome partitioning protein